MQLGPDTTRHVRRQQYPKLRRSKFGNGQGIDFVRCLICGKHLSLISGKHLLTHGTDRETYIQQYRLSPDKLCSRMFRLNHSSRRNYRPHGKQDWIAAIKKHYKQHGHVFAGYLQDNYPHLYNQGIWLFDDWDAALPCSGIHTREYAAMGVLGRQESYQADSRYARRLPLYPSYVLRHHTKLFAVARRQYGSWSKALVAAGIEVPESTNDGRRGVLRALRDSLVHGSENNISQRLRLHAVYYFGSLQKATAGVKNDRRLSDNWSQTKITTVLNRMHKLGQPLGYAAVRRANTRLVSAAEAYFGTWGNALHAAGIDPNLYFRRKWRKRRTTAKRDHAPYADLPSSSMAPL